MSLISRRNLVASVALLTLAPRVGRAASQKKPPAPGPVALGALLPLSGAGKILKTELRKPYWEGKDRAVN